MTTTYATKTASPKAIAYAKSLVSQVRAGDENLPELLLAMDEMTPKAISHIIDTHKPIVSAQKFTAAKAAAPTTDLPAGRYAVEGFDGTVMKYQIDKPVSGKWAGWTFVRDLATGDSIRDRDTKQAILDELEAAGHLESAKLYGKVTGQCGICSKTLTNPDSIAAGIGPICAQKF